MAADMHASQDLGGAGGSRRRWLPRWPTGTWYLDPDVLAFLHGMEMIVIILGVPASLWTYSENKAREREEAQRMAYEKLDDRYWNYERLAMERPHLGVSDAHASDEALALLATPYAKLSPDDRVRHRQMMFLLIAMYERAYVMYADQPTEFRQAQWAGWANGLRRWVQVPEFRAAWNTLGLDFDERFKKYVDGLLPKEEPR